MQLLHHCIATEYIVLSVFHMRAFPPETRRRFIKKRISNHLLRNPQIVHVDFRLDKNPFLQLSGKAANYPVLRVPAAMPEIVTINACSSSGKDSSLLRLL